MNILMAVVLPVALSFYTGVGVAGLKLEQMSFSGPFNQLNQEDGSRLVGPSGWSSGYKTLVKEHFIRLTTDRPSQRGHIWNNATFGTNEMSAVIAFRISGTGKDWFGDGMGIWITQDGQHLYGNNHGYSEKYVGVGIILDTFVNKEHKGGHKDVTVFVNNGTRKLDDMNAETKVGCMAKMRYYELHGAFDPVFSSSRLKIQVKGTKLILSIDEKATGTWSACYTGTVDLPSDWLATATLGITASTGSLSDNHDVLRVNVYDSYDDLEISGSDSDAMLHHLSKEYDSWYDSESCGGDCKLAILQKKMKDFSESFEHKVSDLDEKTKHTVEALQEKERMNQGKIEGLERSVKRMVDKSMSSLMASTNKEMGEKIAEKVSEGLKVHAASWKTPFFVLLVIIGAGVMYLYKQYNALRKTHLL